jgi:hypothetical protein
LVTWAPVQGISISNYEVYLDGALPPSAPTATVVSNGWTMTAANGLTTSSTHSFRVDFVTTDGRRSPISPSASGTTWQGYNWGGIPFEWMSQYYGGDISQWPSATSKIGNSSMTPLKVFLSGGSPLDPSTWLRVQIAQTSQGNFLSWNTQPGATYQVMVSTNFKTWTNVGSPRFAAGTSDSIFVGGGPVGLYQVLLMR